MPKLDTYETYHAMRACERAEKIYTYAVIGGFSAGFLVGFVVCAVAI